MKFVKPAVFKIAETQVDYDGVDAMLKHLGVCHESDAASGAESLTEIMGRLCYMSYGDGSANPNITRTRQGNKPYIENILKSGHGSVMEHATVTFAFIDVSRVFTHEVVRHRAGTAFSQESLRFVRLTDIRFCMPTAFTTESPHGVTEMQEVEAGHLVRGALAILENVQKALASIFKVDSLSFAVKKYLTSAFRRLAPIGLATKIGVTGNHRAWRNIIEQRCNPHAEDEIRFVLAEVAAILKTAYPNLYQDMYEIEPGHWAFENRKV